MDSAFPRPNPNKIRLARFLAQCGVSSRRKAERLIREGRVALDGHGVTEPGISLDPERQRVEVDGRPVQPRPLLYLKFYKPAGVLSTNRDPYGRKTYRDLLPPPFSTRHLFYCGRLDRDSEGLMLLTNDGHLAQQLSHPRHHVIKAYRVWTHAPLSSEVRHVMVDSGVESEGERLRAVRIIPEGRDRQGWRYRFDLREGKKRQIRRMCAAAGVGVMRLIRLAIGPVRLGSLKPGESRPLSPEERESLRRILSRSCGEKPCAI